ncbi:MAG: hypothetical protein DRI61_07270, partial [Chloroflexi bacterium]
GVRTGITGVDIAAESAARTGTRVALEGLTETGVREAGRSVVKNVVLNIETKGANTWRSLPAITRSYVVGATTYPLADNAISLIEKGEPLSLEETINSARVGGAIGVITYGTLKGLGLGISKAYPEAAERVVNGGRFNPEIAELESNPSCLGIRTVEERGIKSLPRWVVEKGKIWGNKAAENLIRGAEGGWWIKTPEGRWIRIENFQKGAISGADLIAPTFKKVASFTAIGPAFTIAGTGVQWLWDLGANLKNGRLELPEAKWTGKELGLNYIEGMLLDTASFAKMGVYLPSLLGTFQAPLEATAEGTVSRALFSSHRISNIFRTAYRGLIKRDSQAIAELAEENLIRDMGRKGLKEIWRSEGAKALVKEIGRRGIDGIDNAFFVTGTIQVTGKISEEVLKALGVSPATAKELGREAGFISLFFIPAPHTFGIIDPYLISVKHDLADVAKKGDIGLIPSSFRIKDGKIFASANPSEYEVYPLFDHYSGKNNRGEWEIRGIVMRQVNEDSGKDEIVVYRIMENNIDEFPTENGNKPFIIEKQEIVGRYDSRREYDGKYMYIAYKGDRAITEPTYEIKREIQRYLLREELRNRGKEEIKEIIEGSASVSEEKFNSLKDEDIKEVTSQVYVKKVAEEENIDGLKRLVSDFGNPYVQKFAAEELRPWLVRDEELRKSFIEKIDEKIKNEDSENEKIIKASQAAWRVFSEAGILNSEEVKDTEAFKVLSREFIKKFEGSEKENENYLKEILENSPHLLLSFNPQEGLPKEIEETIKFACQNWKSIEVDKEGDVKSWGNIEAPDGLKPASEVLKQLIQEGIKNLKESLGNEFDPEKTKEQIPSLILEPLGLMVENKGKIVIPNSGELFGKTSFGIPVIAEIFSFYGKRIIILNPTEELSFQAFRKMAELKGKNVVKEEDFDCLNINNKKALFEELKEKGYISEEGRIESEFRRLKDYTQMRLDNPNFQEKKEQIYNILQQYLAKDFTITIGNENREVNVRILEEVNSASLESIKNADILFIDLGTIQKLKLIEKDNPESVKEIMKEIQERDLTIIDEIQDIISAPAFITGFGGEGIAKNLQEKIAEKMSVVIEVLKNEAGGENGFTEEFVNKLVEKEYAEWSTKNGWGEESILIPTPEFVSKFFKDKGIKVDSEFKKCINAVFEVLGKQPGTSFGEEKGIVYPVHRGYLNSRMSFTGPWRASAYQVIGRLKIESEKGNGEFSKLSEKFIKKNEVERELEKVRVSEKSLQAQAIEVLGELNSLYKIAFTATPQAAIGLREVLPVIIKGWKGKGVEEIVEDIWGKVKEKLSSDEISVKNLSEIEEAEKRFGEDVVVIVPVENRPFARIEKFASEVEGRDDVLAMVAKEGVNGRFISLKSGEEFTQGEVEKKVKEGERLVIVYNRPHYTGIDNFLPEDKTQRWIILGDDTTILTKLSQALRRPRDKGKIEVWVLGKDIKDEKDELIEEWGETLKENERKSLYGLKIKTIREALIVTIDSIFEEVKEAGENPQQRELGNQMHKEFYSQVRENENIVSLKDTNAEEVLRGELTKPVSDALKVCSEDYSYYDKLNPQQKEIINRKIIEKLAEVKIEFEGKDKDFSYTLSDIVSLTRLHPKDFLDVIRKRYSSEELANWKISTQRVSESSFEAAAEKAIEILTDRIETKRTLTFGEVKRKLEEYLAEKGFSQRDINLGIKGVSSLLFSYKDDKQKQIEKSIFKSQRSISDLGRDNWENVYGRSSQLTDFGKSVVLTFKAINSLKEEIEQELTPFEILVAAVVGMEDSPQKTEVLEILASI